MSNKYLSNAWDKTSGSLRGSFFKKRLRIQMKCKTISKKVKSRNFIKLKKFHFHINPKAFNLSLVKSFFQFRSIIQSSLCPFVQWMKAIRKNPIALTFKKSAISFFVQPHHVAKTRTGLKLCKAAEIKFHKMIFFLFRV